MLASLSLFPYTCPHVHNLEKPCEVIARRQKGAICKSERGWSWNSNNLATLCEELTHLKRPWCWERLRAGAEEDDRGWDGWMALLTQWTWVWANFGSWWWTGRPGVLQFMGSQRVGHDWVTELIFFAAKDGEALYSQQKQVKELTVAQIMNSLL